MILKSTMRNDARALTLRMRERVATTRLRNAPTSSVRLAFSSQVQPASGLGEDVATDTAHRQCVSLPSLSGSVAAFLGYAFSLHTFGSDPSGLLIIVTGRRGATRMGHIEATQRNAWREHKGEQDRESRSGTKQ
eukprot:150489-Pleurochrysis_carterae.AAC.1